MSGEGARSGVKRPGPRAIPPKIQQRAVVSERGGGSHSNSSRSDLNRLLVDCML